MSKRQFVQISHDDIPIGKPLRWPLYVRSGELLAPAGSLIADSAAHARLMAAKPLRVAVDNRLGSAVGIPEEPVQSKPEPEIVDPLNCLKHNVEGVVLIVKLQGDYEPRMIPVELYGRIPFQALIVSVPKLTMSNGQTWQHLEGMSLSVQVILGRSLCVFSTSILRFSGAPSGHLFLRYPQETVIKPFRKALRVKAKIPASITTDDGHAVTGVITDISGSGCAIDTEFIIGEIGTPLNIAFRLKIGNKSHVLRFPCVIKSNKSKLSQQHSYGLQFDDAVAEADLLILKSFFYEYLAEN